jgi:hypothetical protein
VGQEHAKHWEDSIEKHYQISCDWTGIAYCGLQLDWDYTKNVDLSIWDYIKAALHKLQYSTPTSPENAPHTWNPSVYGYKNQYIEAQEDIPLPQKDVTRIKQLAGTPLHRTTEVDPTLILPVNVLASEQTQATTATADKVIKLLD